MGFREEYGELLQAIAQEADAIAMRYFRAVNCELKGRATGRGDASGSRRGRNGAGESGASGLALDVLGKRWVAVMRSPRALRGERA